MEMGSGEVTDISGRLLGFGRPRRHGSIPLDEIDWTAHGGLEGVRQGSVITELSIPKKQRDLAKTARQRNTHDMDSARLASVHAVLTGSHAVLSSYNVPAS